MGGVLVVLMAGGPLAAQPPEGAGSGSSASREARAGDAEEAEARALFERGRDAYEAGRFEEAVRDFEAALERVRDVRVRVLMLLNIARGYDRLGHRERALDYYEQYVRLMPEGPHGSDVRARIRALRRRLGRDPLGEAPERSKASWVPWAVAAGAVVLGGVVALAILLPGDERLPEEVGTVQWSTTALGGIAP